MNQEEVDLDDIADAQLCLGEKPRQNALDDNQAKSKGHELFMLSILLPDNPELVLRFVSYDHVLTKIVGDLQSYVRSLAQVPSALPTMAKKNPFKIQEMGQQDRQLTAQ